MILLEKALLNGLISEDIPFHEVMNAFNIRSHIAFDLDGKVLGFVYVSRKGNYHIILNGNVNYMTQCNVLVHEIKHIIHDLPRMPYIIGIDMQREKFEIDKDTYKLQML